jgi:hypothetical protein
MANSLPGNKKSALDFSVKDAPAALPQNCQTTKWILRNYSFRVNVTLVMEIFCSAENSQIEALNFREELLLLVPGFAIVGCRPDFAGGG